MEVTFELMYAVYCSWFRSPHNVLIALLRKNIYGFKRRIVNINNDLNRVMYNCFEIVNGPMWISWANSLYTVNL